MTRSEIYSEMDKIIAKESNKKEDPYDRKEKDSTEGKNFSGGENFVCSIDCKHCPSM